MSTPTNIPETPMGETEQDSFFESKEKFQQQLQDIFQTIMRLTRPDQFDQLCQWMEYKQYPTIDDFYDSSYNDPEKFDTKGPATEYKWKGKMNHLSPNVAQKLKSFVRWMTHEDRPYELHDDFLATLTRDSYLKFRHMDALSFSASSPSHHEPYKLKTSFSGEPKHQTPSESQTALNNFKKGTKGDASALPQFLTHHNCDDLDPTDTPSAVPTALQAPSDDTYNPRCTHSLMETQCNHSQYPILMKQNCTHNPSTSQVRKSYHSNPVTFPYPPDPGEHVLETSSAPTTLVERDKLDLSSLVPPKEEMESSFSWTYPFKSPTSSTLCFGEPTLGKLNQETDFYMTKHMPKPSSGANRVSVSHSSFVTKNGEHFYGENFIHDFPKSWKHIKEVDWGDKLKLNYTTYGYMLMEIDWGGKFNYTSCGCPMTNWQGHETHPTGHKTSEVDWGGHDPNPNHVNESLLSEVDWGAHNPDADDPEQLTGESIQSFLTFVDQLQWLVALGRLVTHAQVTTLSKLMVASS